MDTKDTYSERLALVHAEIEAAARKALRDRSEVRLIGVTKTVDASAVAHLLDAGITDFGENRWQHARELLGHPRAKEGTWHYIGHLQSNKVKYVVPNFSFIHSIDSLLLAREIEQFAVKHGRKVHGLIQVNVSGEETKFGIHPEEAFSVLHASKDFEALHVAGLMTMAPADATDNEIRGFFRSLRQLRDDLRERTGAEDFTELSMGMSNDFAIAVEEGATMIRVGRRLMGPTEK